MGPKRSKAASTTRIRQRIDSFRLVNTLHIEPKPTRIEHQTMQWYFALTEDSTAFRQYAEMAMVAVHTARKVTSLEPHCIYEGGDNDFTAWLVKRGVRLIRHRSFVRDALADLGRRKGNPHLAAALPGAFSR